MIAKSAKVTKQVNEKMFPRSGSFVFSVVSGGGEKTAVFASGSSFQWENGGRKYEHVQEQQHARGIGDTSRACRRGLKLGGNFSSVGSGAYQTRHVGAQEKDMLDPEEN